MLSVVLAFCPQSSSSPFPLSVLFCKGAKLCKMHFLGIPLIVFPSRFGQWGPLVESWKVGGKEAFLHLSLYLGSECLRAGFRAPWIDYHDFWICVVVLNKQHFLLALMLLHRADGFSRWLHVSDLSYCSLFWFSAHPSFVKLILCLKFPPFCKIGTFKINSFGTTRSSFVKKKLVSHLIPFTRTHSKWIRDLNLKIKPKL